ncbi:hypothetical protein [Mucilaginibacter paludis]|uniref:Lipocalin-like domain-containing protein n=1 Tax=Mucilaginibacter paludis DSM 18603 TaxID=714943 RepID=H1Y2U7_9SPHI|nr:hypothetical protein [Mucilaginibacter paludis]EHQ28492.1 hypothetical protein Mucpa_4402 [Mucilaginibacter paludis DSM 18603]
MKRIFQIATVIASVLIIFSSCSVVSKTAGVDRSRFVGTWTVTGVTYEGIIGAAVQKAFDQAPPTAFAGSTWQLTNSGNGVYTLTDGTSQSIYWSYYNPGGGVEPQFQFKKVYQGDKLKNIDSGYRLVIGSIDGSSMVLKSPIDLNGKTGYVVYSFNKK